MYLLRHPHALSLHLVILLNLIYLSHHDKIYHLKLSSYWQFQY